MEGIDIEYIWQHRIHSGMRSYQRSEVTYSDCAAIGLEFNIASKRKEKLDLELMTNGVVIDICDFAKSAAKGDKYFICEILEYNFDLAFENEHQRYEFATQVQLKARVMKDRTKNKRNQRNEPFVLPVPKALGVNTRFHGQLWEISEPSGMPSEGCKNGDVKVTPSESVQAENPTTTENPTPSESVKAENRTPSESVKADPNGELTEELILHKRRVVTVDLNDLYPLCKKVGLDLVIGSKGKPKQKLSQDVLTKGMMIEITDFARLLSGNFIQIIFDVLEHNFDLDLNSDKIKARQNILKLLETRNAGFTAERRAAFRKDVFSFHMRKTGKKWKKRLADHSATLLETKRRPKPKLRADFASSQEEALWQDYDLSYTFPVEDTEMELDLEDERIKMEMRCSSEITNGTEPAALQEIKQEEEEVSISSVVPCSEDSDLHQQLYTPGSNNTAQGHISDLFSQDTKEGIIKMELTSEPDVQEIETDKKTKIWRRRDARSKRILSKSNKVNYSFSYCRKAGLDFNVGSGAKQNLNLQMLTNGVLFEVCKFASAMTRTRGHYLLDILERNFTLGIQNEVHRRNFLVYITQKVKSFTGYTGKAKVALLRKVFEVPEVYNEVDVTCDFPSPQDLLTEQLNGWDSPSAAATHTSMELYPLCKEIGLNLWGVEERPTNEKLDLSLLTNGVVLEVVNFAKELCGSVWPIVYDVLEHNFDLDLQDGKTKDARRIHKWYLGQKRLKTKKPYSSTVHGLQEWLNTVVRLKARSRGNAVYTKLRSSVPNGNRLKDVTEKRRLELDRRKEALTSEEPPAKMVKCNSFPLCQEIGLDLNIKSKSVVKAKLDLQVLTRAVIYEMHRFIEEHYKANYVSALYEILQYNFDLSSQDHRRWDFALSIGSQVKAMVGRYMRHLTKRGDYPNIVFELPFELTGQIVCKEESSDSNSDLEPDGDNVLFVRELIPFDIEVELE